MDPDTSRTPTPEPTPIAEKVRESSVDLSKQEGEVIQIKKTELKKLKESFGLDEEAVIQLVNENVEKRSDRNNMADFVILKHTNAMLRKKVEEQRAELQEKELYVAKQHNMIKVQAAEIKEAVRSVAHLRDGNQKSDRIASQVVLLQKQLSDLKLELHEERHCSSRVAEDLIMTMSRQPSPNLFPQPVNVRQATLAASVASLATAVVIFHLTDETVRPLISEYSPVMVASSLAIVAHIATTTEAIPTAFTSRGVSTDTSVTEYKYVPPLEDIPRGQELMKTLREKDGEISNLRRELMSHSETTAATQRIIEKLERELTDRAETIANQNQEYRNLEEISTSQTAALEARVGSIRVRFLAVCQEVTRLRKGQDGSSAKPDQKSMPVPIPRGIHQMPTNSSSGQNQSIRHAESPSKGSGCSDSDDTAPFMEMPIEDPPAPPTPIDTPAAPESTARTLPI